MNLKEWPVSFYRDRFKRYLTVMLILVGIIVFISEDRRRPEPRDKGTVQIHFFYHPACPHCKAQIRFNQMLKKKYPQISFAYHDVSNGEERQLLMAYADRAGLSRQKLGVPATFFGRYQFMGFVSKETTGREIESALKSFLDGQPGAVYDQAGPVIEMPLIGRIDPHNYTLPVLAIILGTADGFNPCALWALGYLIGLAVELNDRRKIWLLVGSFVFASGILYFLFMTAWLNAFFLIGYIRILTLGIGLVAIGIGLNNVRDFVRTKGGLACDLSSGDKKERTQSRMRRLVRSPQTITTLFGIVSLAFVVNSIEFVCSSAIPAVFTQVLALSRLPTFKYYLYILLYDLFFMLDDFIIFGLAAFAAGRTIGTRYARLNKLVGGTILLLLGLTLTFAPDTLR
ncbi:MAG: hypothetical protein V1736_05115 [Pseudomonadota bacterium]